MVRDGNSSHSKGVSDVFTNYTYAYIPTGAKRFHWVTWENLKVEEHINKKSQKDASTYLLRMPSVFIINNYHINISKKN